MILLLIEVCAVLALTYFLSRLLLRIRSFPKTDLGLRLAHIASALAILLLDFAVKYPVSGFESRNVLLIALCQVVWFAFDRSRKHLPAGRPV